MPDTSQNLNCFRDKRFTWHASRDLPKPLFGHCQVSLDENRIFVYGGTTSTSNGSKTLLHYSEDAYIWHNHNSGWLHLPSKCPCPDKVSTVSFPQQCVMRKGKNDIIITSTYEGGKTCASVLNLNNYLCDEIKTESELPLGGFLLSGNTNLSVFYLGGVNSDDIFELSMDNKWKMSGAKLPFPMAMNDTQFTTSNLNVSNCAENHF